MIVGIGTDIVETRRMADNIERHGDRFARRLLAACEWPSYRAAPDGPAFLAKRFAAKEAFGKATGTGVRAPVTLQSMWVDHDDLGKPSLGIDEELARWLTDRGVRRWHLSLSDERDYALAFVVLEGDPTDRRA